MRKKRCFATILATQFLSCTDICNSPYLYAMSVIRRVAYMVQLISTQLQFCRNNFFSTTMQLPCDYNHNVMLTSFFIHPSNFNTWHYEKFSWFFWNIDIHCPLWLFILDGIGLWHVAQYKNCHMAYLIEFWKQIYICTSIGRYITIGR
jgi:hypothetical protein